MTGLYAYMARSSQGSGLPDCQSADYQAVAGRIGLAAGRPAAAAGQCKASLLTVCNCAEACLRHAQQQVGS